VRGVSATNQNDLKAARQDFLQAYSLDPNSAFSLNNVGYVAEMDGDLETAEFFYERARKAMDANARVGLATRRAAEGMNLVAVAADSDEKVDGKIVEEDQARRQHPGPVELKHRDNTPVVEPAPDVSQSPAAPQPPASQPPTSQSPQ
jgi:tetratricopeptide (TPR) repeat protein